MEEKVAREPIHPGEFLQDELTELGMSAAELARVIRVPPNRVGQILARRGRDEPAAAAGLACGILLACRGCPG